MGHLMGGSDELMKSHRGDEIAFLKLIEENCLIKDVEWQRCNVLLKAYVG